MYENIVSFPNHLMEMPPERRRILEASVVGVLLGWGMGA
jgi:hypothetical protein